MDTRLRRGFFTRKIAAATGGSVAGLGVDPEWVEYLRVGDGSRPSYAVADARALPCDDQSLGLAMSITASCFIPEERGAIREILRVTRRRFAIGLLNRHSLLWWRIFACVQ